MEKNQIFTPKTTPSSLAMHKNSQTISKTKPKIRIIHIFAPEIIKTDAANFRELVQRLTGKPTDDRNPKKPRISRTANKKMEMIKGEEEKNWRGADSGGGFLGGFTEFEYGLMQEINTHFPFFEGTTQMDVYGESLQLARSVSTFGKNI